MRVLLLNVMLLKIFIKTLIDKIHDKWESDLKEHMDEHEDEALNMLANKKKKILQYKENDLCLNILVGSGLPKVSLPIKIITKIKQVYIYRILVGISYWCLVEVGL